MYYKVARQIYRELSIKHDLPIGTIEDICRAPLELFDWITKNKVDKESYIFPSLRISGFGVFYVATDKIRRKRIIDSIKKEKKLKDNEQHASKEYKDTKE